MTFFELPDSVFLEIFRHLPFKDRVRAGGVDSAFRRMSEIAISETKVLDIGEYVRGGNNFTPLAFSALMNLCAKNLQEMRFTSFNDDEDEDEDNEGEGDEKQKLARMYYLLNVFGHFHYPNLTSFYCKMGGDTDTLQMVLTNNPNLKSLFVGKISFPDTITSENLVHLRCDCTEDGLRSLTGRIPNLKSINAGMMKFKSPAVAMSLDAFLATVPNLDTLKLRLYGHGLDLEKEAMDSFWQLKRLVSLEIEDDDVICHRRGEASNIGDNTLMKMAESFPGLRTLTLPSHEITGPGFTALSRLRDLQVLALKDYCSNEADDGSAVVVRQLSKCGSLRWIHLGGGYFLSLPAVGRLCRSCPRLSYVSCWELKGFDDKSEEQAAAMVHQSFTGIGKRRIEFMSDTTSQRTLDILRSKPVKDAQKKLKEEQGLELECGWTKTDG